MIGCDNPGAIVGSGLRAGHSTRSLPKASVFLLISCTCKTKSNPASSSLLELWVTSGMLFGFVRSMSRQRAQTHTTVWHRMHGFLFWRSHVLASAHCQSSGRLSIGSTRMPLPGIRLLVVAGSASVDAARPRCRTQLDKT